MNNLPIDDILVLMFTCIVFLFGILTFIYWRIKTSEEKRMKESARIAKERMIQDIKEREERTEKFFDDQETFLKDWSEHTTELREAGVFDDKLNDNAEYAKRGMCVGDRVTLEEADKLFKMGINEVTLISGETCYSPEFLEKIIECNKKYNNGGFIPNDDKEPAGVVHKGYTINPNSPLEYPNFEFIYQGMDRLAEYNNKIELQELHTKLRYGIKGE